MNSRLSGQCRVALLAGIAILAAGIATNAWSQATGAAAAAERARSAPNALTSLAYAVLPGGAVVIKLTFRNEIRERPPVIAGYHPVANVVLDLADTASELASDRVEIGHRDVRGVQIVTGTGRARIVVNVNRPVSWEIELAGKELLLTLRRPAPG